MSLAPRLVPFLPDLSALPSADAAPPAADLSPAGWTIMLAWLAFVVGLTGWCYARVLRTPRRESDA